MRQWYKNYLYRKKLKGMRLQLIEKRAVAVDGLYVSNSPMCKLKQESPPSDTGPVEL